jgi:hypothetical protein
MVLFCYTFAFMAVTKAETLVFWLCAVQKNFALCIIVLSHNSAQCCIVRSKKKIHLPLGAMQLSVKFKPTNFFLSPRYASLRKVIYIWKFFCEFETICKNYFNPLINDWSGIDWWKNRGPKILWDCLVNVITSQVSLATIFFTLSREGTWSHVILTNIFYCN